MIASLVLTVLMFVGVQSAQAPIHIDSCTMQSAGSFERGVQIRYKNVSSHTVSGVGFDVSYNRHHVVIEDRGSVAPGDTVDRVLTTPTWELYHSANQACDVAYVYFSDGTAWHRQAGSSSGKR